LLHPFVPAAKSREYAAPVGSGGRHANALLADVANNISLIVTATKVAVVATQATAAATTIDRRRRMMRF